MLCFQPPFGAFQEHCLTPFRLPPLFDELMVVQHIVMVMMLVVIKEHEGGERKEVTVKT